MSAVRLKDCYMVPNFVQSLYIIGLIPSDVKGRLHNKKIEIICMEYADIIANLNESEGVTDCILCSFTSDTVKQLADLLEPLKSVLAHNGRLTVFINDNVLVSERHVELGQAFTKNWSVYHEGAISSGLAPQGCYGITFVHNSYDPISHATELSGIGRPDYALAILNEISPDNIQTEDALVTLLSEKQRHFLTWQQLFKGHAPDHLFFTKERREFGLATSIRADFTDSYRIHSQFWSFIGRSDMALRTLRSIEYVCPQEQTRKMISSLEIEAEKPSYTSLRELPLNGWQDSWPVPRILVISHEYSDYGIDTLYHGLCTLLGKENVVEYPWKPTLHGQNFQAAHEYPCVFTYPGLPASIADLVLQLQAGCFDFILFSDIADMELKDDVRQLMNAAPDIPVVVYDTWDDCYTPMPLILEYLGRSEVDLVFKREMLAGIEYDANTYPLPFGYQERLAMPCFQLEERNSKTPFWAGKKIHGLRPLYIRHLESIFGKLPEARIGLNEYQSKLRSSLIGLCLFGFGFDSVRYWEIPANGAMLLAERPPILIPNDFEENISAVFFDDVADMEAKLEFYLQRTDKAAEIAENGYKHYLKYHTTTARARLFLGISLSRLAHKLPLCRFHQQRHTTPKYS